MGKRQNQHESNRSLETHTCVLTVFMPGRFRRLQSQQICMVLLLTSRPTKPSLNQTIGTHGQSNLPIRLTSLQVDWKTGTPLCPWLTVLLQKVGPRRPISRETKKASKLQSGLTCHTRWEYSQWLPGSENQVADALSWDMDRTNNKLSQIFFTHIPSQLPTSFKIVLLPNEVVSWMTLLILKLPMNPQYNKAHTMTILGRLWKRLVECWVSTGLPDDIFLTDLMRQQCTHIFNFFAMAVHEGRFLQPSDAPLASGEVKTTINIWQWPLGVTVSKTHQEIQTES